MRSLISFVALITILGFNTYSQIVFENGYFINESDQKVNCLIRNVEWKNNPDEFEYKISEEEAVQRAGIRSIKEFGIYGDCKYIRAKVKIDRSGDKLNTISSERNPSFQEESLFLNVIIEGKASLYSYEHGNLTRFFYTINDSDINQLVYKRYWVNGKDIAENNLFRQQLLSDLKCPGIKSNIFEYVKYTKKDLEKLFVRYNECVHSEYASYDSKKERDFFNISIRPGFKFSNLVILNSEYGSRYNFGDKSDFRFGIEAEYILPYNKNKWSIISEPTFQYFKSEKTKQLSGGILVARVNYQSIELPIGIRHYFFLNDKSKIFINASTVIDVSNNSNIEFVRNNNLVANTLDIKSRMNIGLGLGFEFKDRYSIEMSYQTNREILGSYLYWHSDYKTFSIVLGYSLF